jgi:hypothetical protein
MDLNYLYHRQQVALFKSDNATSAQSRSAHLALAEGYAAEISAAKRLTRVPDEEAPGTIVAFRDVEIVA